MRCRPQTRSSTHVQISAPLLIKQILAFPFHYHDGLPKVVEESCEG
jgi:hypothetical protein